MSRTLTAIDEISSIYLFIADEKGDMRLAVCDAQISEKIDAKYLSDKLELLNEASVVVIDCNLTEEAIAFITENCTAPVFADPVSVTKAAKLFPVLDRIHTLKPNLLEAELLSGVQINGEESLRLAGERPAEHRLQSRKCDRRRRCGYGYACQSIYGWLFAGTICAICHGGWSSCCGI